MLADSQGRQFHYLRLSITDVCNFSCDYCLPDGYKPTGNRHFLSGHEITETVKAFAHLGTTKVRITGGEPSLRKDLPDIIASCKQIRGINKVVLTTNGHKLKQHLPAWKSAGLDAMNISIDTLDPRQFHAITGHNALSSILEGINVAIEMGMKVKVNTVLMSSFNQQRLDGFLKWVKHTKVTLRFIELMQTGNNLAFFNEQRLSGEPILQQLLAKGWIRQQRDKNAGPAIELAHPDYLGKIGLILPYSKDFCATCNRLRVSATGKLHLCLFTEEGIDLRSFIPEGYEVMATKLQHLVGQKKSTHFLHEGDVGGNLHFASIGG